MALNNGTNNGGSALGFDSIFGSRPVANSQRRGANQQGSEELPKAEFWLNIGYIVQAPEGQPFANGDTERFVSLPAGIPLDSMTAVAIRGNNAEYNAFVSAKNTLMEKVKEIASELQPGEERIFGDQSGLCIQLRRTQEAPVATPASQNMFVPQNLFG